MSIDIKTNGRDTSASPSPRSYFVQQPG